MRRVGTSMYVSVDDKIKIANEGFIHNIDSGNRNIRFDDNVQATSSADIKYPWHFSVKNISVCRKTLSKQFYLHFICGEKAFYSRR